MSDDRPVSLAAVLDVLAMLGFDKVSHAADEMRDIPTVAPATHGGGVGGPGRTVTIDLTTPPKPSPAPEMPREWSGPDRWQVWTTENPNVHPEDEPAEPCPDEFAPIGPWEFEWLIVQTKAFRDWRRPLRRVQP